MAKPEIQSTIFGSRQSITQITQFLHILLKSKNSDIINDIRACVLCCVLSNELFIKIILLLLVLCG